MKKEKRIKRNMTKMNQVYKWDAKIKKWKFFKAHG